MLLALFESRDLFWLAIAPEGKVIDYIKVRFDRPAMASRTGNRVLCDISHQV